MKYNKEHLWIPDNEVDVEKKTNKAVTQKPEIQFEVHGKSLSKSLSTISKGIRTDVDDGPLSDIVIFRVKTIQQKKVQDSKEIFDSGGMELMAVRNNHDALVSTTRKGFEKLVGKVSDYAHNGYGKSRYDYVDDFCPNVGKDKITPKLKTELDQELRNSLMLQMVLVPKLETEGYDRLMADIEETVVSNEGAIVGTCALTDGTRIISATIPADTIDLFEDNPFIYRIDMAESASIHDYGSSVRDLDELKLDTTINADNLPIVVVLDSGIKFPPQFSHLVIDHWIPEEFDGGDCNHGTCVATKVVFGYIGEQISAGIMTPRARVIDCNIIEEKAAVTELIPRIRKAVEKYHKISKVFSMSINTDDPIDGDTISIFGAEIDSISSKYGVQFIISAGNHHIWEQSDSLSEIIDDSDSKLSSPGDSLHSVIVGSIVGAEHERCISRKGEIAPYSRIGPGFKGTLKPDVCAYGGAVSKSMGVLCDQYSATVCPDKITDKVGTSFSAPIVAGDFAILTNAIPDNNILLARALMYHHATPCWKEQWLDEDSLQGYNNLYGRGLVNLDRCLKSSESSVTFIRCGKISRGCKEKVRFYMPPSASELHSRGQFRVSVTCVSKPILDQNKGAEYVGAYVKVALRKATNKDELGYVNSKVRNAEKWDVCQQRMNPFMTVVPGDWEIHLEASSRWEKKDEQIPYALVITLEDTTHTRDLYSEILNTNRYTVMNRMMGKIRI